MRSVKYDWAGIAIICLLLGVWRCNLLLLYCIQITRKIKMYDYCYRFYFFDEGYIGSI